MKRFAVVQHTYSEFLGLIENQLEKRDIGFEYFRPFVGQALPGSAVQFDALFLLGSDRPTSDRAAGPWIEEELRLIERFKAARKPVVGIGGGALLVAEALGGGTALASPPDTARWVTAQKTPAGAGDALADVLDGQTVLALHHGSVRLPESVAPILVDDTGGWLAIRPDPMSYALLFRPELKPGMIEDMIMEAGRRVPDNIGELLVQARERWDDTQRITGAVIVALVRELQLMAERRKPPVFRLRVD